MREGPPKPVQDISGDEERRAEYLRHRSEPVSAALKDMGGDMQQVVQLLENDPSRMQEMLADLRMYSGFLTRMAQEAKGLEEHAAFDTLTELPNRRHFLEMLRMNVSHAKRQERHGGQQKLHVLFIDLDHFKSINDNPVLGHDVGDLYLKTVASHMQKALHREYDMVARNGGDEFAVLLLDCDDTMARHIAERLREAVREGSAEARRVYTKQKGVILPANEANVTASIGVAAYDATDNDSSEILLKQADQAMYAAKDAGKDRVVFYSEIAEGGEDGEDHAPTRAQA